MKKFPIKVLVAAAVAVGTLGAASSAHALLTNPNTGNGSLIFIALDGADRGPNIAPTVSLALDMGFLMGDLLTAQAGVVREDGRLAAAGTTAVWNFNNNTLAVNGAQVAGNYQWSSQLQTFLGAQQNGYSWAVLGADNVTGAVSPSNLILNRNTIMTGRPPLETLQGFTLPLPVSNAVGNLSEFTAAGFNLGTNVAGTTGGFTATSGNAYVNSVLNELYGAYSNNVNYFERPGETSWVTWVNQRANPLAFVLGAPLGEDALSTNPSTFRFDGTNNTLTWVSAVPEPGTVATMLAGLAVLGFMTVRRQKRG